MYKKIDTEMFLFMIEIDWNRNHIFTDCKIIKFFSDKDFTMFVIKKNENSKA